VKLAHKLIVGVLLLMSLIWGVGLYAVAASRRALEDSIEQSSAVLAAAVMNEVDRAVHTAIDDWLIYSAGPLVRGTVKASNEEFEKLPDVRAYIDRHDADWRSAPSKTVTPFMGRLLKNELSEAMRRKLDAFERDEGYRAYGEVFITNRYGANVAQTGKTTDYRQDDEEWWQRARADRVYVADVQYDESAGVYSVDICVRVDDDNGDFIGVIKAVFDIEGIFTILRSRMSHPQYGAGREGGLNLILLTADKKVIFPSTDSFPGLADGSRFLQGHDRSDGSPAHSYRRHDAEGGEILACCAISQGKDEFKGLGWMLIVEHRAEDILAPVAALRSNILVISAAATVVGLALGVGFSISTSRRITRLKNAALQIGKGDLHVVLDNRATDEIGQLAGSFNRMTQELSETLVSKAALEEANRALKSEISERKRAEEEQQKALRELRDVNQLMTGREQRVMELKKQINELRAELGRERPYQTTA